MASSKKRARKDTTEESDGDSGRWECTVCTYRNRYEAFKCEMCGTRKGTSTRKPRLNQDVQQIHSAVHNFVLQQHQKLPAACRRNPAKPQVSVESPTTSRYSPESTCSLPKVSQAAGGHVKGRKPVPISESLIYRTGARKMQVTVKNVTQIITEFRPRAAVPHK